MRSSATAEGPCKHAMSAEIFLLLLYNCTNYHLKRLAQANDLQHHSRSLVLVPTDTPHMISY